MIVEFDNLADALKVAEHLRDVEIAGNFLFFNDNSSYLLNTVCGLAGGIKPSYVTTQHKCALTIGPIRNFCILPFKPLPCDNDVPQIYVACVAAYSNSTLHGMWIDATQDPEDIQADIDYMLSFSPVIELRGDPDYLPEEWRIDDSSDFGSIRVDYLHDLEKISCIANLIKEHGNAVDAYFQQFGTDADPELFLDSFAGKYDSEESFVYEILSENETIKKMEELGISEHWLNYEAIAREWEYNSDYYFVDYGYEEVYVFRC